ncbi:MAG: hypothetical protein KatS3mg076_2345 [Candidatus Binatia bacterium]|nr:MAG: hypothetical protein KatS3mg076_2345 [Candidatus Binatia bacterium]
MASEVARLPRAETKVSDLGAVYWHGVLSGILGAAAVAVWFLYLDWARGRPLYTPTVLAYALVGEREALSSLDELRGSVPMTLLFTAVHGFVFLVIGVAASRLVDVLKRRFNLLLALVLFFVVLQLAFAAFAMTFSAVVMEALEWPDVVFGNAIAAALMATHLVRGHPSLHPPED